MAELTPATLPFFLFRLPFFLSLFLCTALIFNGYSQIKPEKGKASYYSDDFEGRKTASGEKYNKNDFTAAHRTLPFGTILKVTNLKNGKSVIVKINDRGPYSGKRIIDLSYAAANEIDMIRDGVADVRIEPGNIIHDKAPVVKNNQPSTIREQGYYTSKGHPVQKPKGYLIQTGSFSSYKNAVARIKELQALKTEKTCYLQFVTVKKKKVYRVCTGPFSSESDAKAAQVVLKNHGYESLILKP